MRTSDSPPLPTVPPPQLYIDDGSDGPPAGAATCGNPTMPVVLRAFAVTHAGDVIAFDVSGLGSESDTLIRHTEDSSVRSARSSSSSSKPLAHLSATARSTAPASPTRTASGSTARTGPAPADAATGRTSSGQRDSGDRTAARSSGGGGPSKNKIGGSGRRRHSRLEPDTGALFQAWIRTSQFQSTGACPVGAAGRFLLVTTDDGSGGSNGGGIHTWGQWHALSN